MKRYFSYLLVALFTTLFLNACSKDDNIVDPASSESEYRLFINEILPKNAISMKDENGNAGDWIEIYNDHSEEINIEGLIIRYEYEDNGSPIAFDYSIIEQTLIPAKGFQIIWCDGTSEGLHTNFDLKAQKGGTISIIENSGLIVDAVTYSGTEATLGIEDLSIARESDGGDIWIPFGPGYNNWPTPGLSNAAIVQPPSTAEIFINELMAKNSATIADPNGNFSDWIEIYNKGNEDVNLIDWKVKYEYTDGGETVAAEYIIPVETIIPAEGYLLIWCDESGAGLFTNFDLKTRKGGKVSIIDTNDVEIDFIDYTSTDIVNGTDDLSYGRKNNGGGTWFMFGPGYEKMPSPGASNR